MAGVTEIFLNGLNSSFQISHQLQHTKFCFCWMATNTHVFGGPFALANDVHLSTVTYSTHLLQLLYVAVFRPFKKALDGTCAEFMRTNAQACINRYDLSWILKNAWYEAMKPSNSIAGFRTAGSQPLHGPWKSSRLPVLNPFSTYFYHLLIQIVFIAKFNHVSKCTVVLL